MNLDGGCDDDDGCDDGDDGCDGDDDDHDDDANDAVVDPRAGQGVKLGLDCMKTT